MFDFRARTVLYAGISAALILAMSCGRGEESYPKRMIVLGVDGMDPGFVERHWADLPNLRRLRDQGSFTRLQTSSPPQSPVASVVNRTGSAPRRMASSILVHRRPGNLCAVLIDE